jgi:SAM-dependent methyltransferase
MASFSGAVRQTLRPWFERLPPNAQARLRTLKRWPVVARLLVPAAHRVHPPGTVKWGSLRRTAPFSRDWGYDRGTPIDRVYIDHFLATRADDIQGACLEVMNADYTVRFGGTRVTGQDVLDIDPANTRATIVADLGEENSLPEKRFDCVIFTQTLHLIPDMRIALGNIWRAIAPGGVLLLTVPALGRHDTRPGFHHDRWRVTKTGLEWLLAGLPGGRADTTTYGNVLSCTAFLYGLAAGELKAEELHVTDSAFPLIVATRVKKESTR